jgi:regulator of cell morphogenesis and NO signaling
MTITPETTVAEIARTEPGTIKVFQRHNMDFCCGGKIPLAQACAQYGVDERVLLDELEAATRTPDAERDWTNAPLADLVTYVQERFHEPLREELPRLSAMLDRVVTRHGDRFPDTLLPLHATFERLRQELLSHMAKEDQVLFPAVVALEASAGALGSRAAWIAQPIQVMEAEHDAAGAALARIRELTGGHVPPPDVCPTFQGLYYGLAQLEREMHVHVHLENNILFPRAAELAGVALA